jgi:hypothetical protein
MQYLVFSLSLLALAAVTVIYAAFDVFNDRNVPNSFAYASVILGLAVTVAFNSGILVFSIALALLVGALGYLVYRMGFWGAGDVFELAAVTLLLPLQNSPLLPYFTQISQLGLPFVLSVFIATGFAAVWLVPIYYLIVYRNEEVTSRVSGRRIALGAALLATYAALFLVIYALYGISPLKVVILVAIAVPSALTMIFEEKITAGMIRFIPPRELEEGDMIATNMLSAKESARLSKRYKGFGRLVTKKFIGEVKGAKESLPVYRNAVPLAVFILAGVVISLLLGNLILLMI